MSFSLLDQVFANAEQRRFCRVLAEMQCGQPVLIEAQAPLLVLAAEQASDEHVDAFFSLSDERAFLLAPSGLLKHLGIETQHSLLALKGDALTLQQHVRHWLAEDAPSHSTLTPEPACNGGKAAITLAQQATVMPLLFALPVTQDQLAELKAQEIAHIRADETSLTPKPDDLLTTPMAALPLEVSETATAFAFRLRYQPQWNLAVFFGDASKANPLVRVHSSCLTGDILGSLRCDCGSQLHSALEALATADCGMLIYLSQEGRGIGLGNKLKAYHLQEKGLDTLDANEALGFEVDARDFTLAALLLQSLKKDSIRLLTNNPRKIRELETLGIQVNERVPLEISAGEHNHRYLETKALRMGHMLKNKS